MLCAYVGLIIQNKNLHFSTVINTKGRFTLSSQFRFTSFCATADFQLKTENFLKKYIHITPLLLVQMCYVITVNVH
jgi:hypothetical protein